jgi:hypothetical protein
LRGQDFVLIILWGWGWRWNWTKLSFGVGLKVVEDKSIKWVNMLIFIKNPNVFDNYE